MAVKIGRTSARRLVVRPEDSMSQLLGCLQHLQTGVLSMVTSVWGTENNYRGINQGSREDGGARPLVFGVKILVQQLPGAMPRRRNQLPGAEYSGRTRRILFHRRSRTLK